jgi:hypothetical protein
MLASLMPNEANLRVQSYTIFLGSFGRTGSGEDVSDTSRDHRNEDLQCPAEYRTAKVHKSEPGMRDCCHYKYISRPNSRMLSLPTTYVFTDIKQCLVLLNPI